MQGNEELATLKLFDAQMKNTFWRAQYPLHAAVCDKNVKETEFLLKFGYAVDRVDSYGLTPLIYCIRAEDLDMVKVLLRAGADPNKSSAQGVLPLWVADDDHDFREVARMLRQYGARR